MNEKSPKTDLYIHKMSYIVYKKFFCKNNLSDEERKSYNIYYLTKIIQGLYDK